MNPQEALSNLYGYSVAHVNHDPERMSEVEQSLLVLHGLIQKQTIQVSDVLRGVRFAVSHYGPNWVDPNINQLSCKYAYERDGMTRYCIIGHWLHAAGLLEDVDLTQPSMDSFKSGTINTLNVSAFFKEALPHVMITQEALDLAMSIQQQQDRGSTWGECLNMAELDLLVDRNYRSLEFERNL